MAITHRRSIIRAYICLTLLTILQHCITRAEQSEREQGSAVPTLIHHADTNQVQAAVAESPDALICSGTSVQA